MIFFFSTFLIHASNTIFCGIFQRKDIIYNKCNKYYNKRPYFISVILKLVLKLWSQINADTYSVAHFASKKEWLCGSLKLVNIYSCYFIKATSIFFFFTNLSSLLIFFISTINSWCLTWVQSKLFLYVCV